MIYFNKICMLNMKWIFVLTQFKVVLVVHKAGLIWGKYILPLGSEFSFSLAKGIRQVICQLNHQNRKLRLAQGKQYLRDPCPKYRRELKIFFFWVLLLKRWGDPVARTLEMPWQGIRTQESQSLTPSIKKNHLAICLSHQKT